MKNSTTPLLLGSANPAIEMPCAAPEATPPRRICVSTIYLQIRTALPCLGEALRQGTLLKFSWFNDFRGSGANSRSCLFQQSPE
jgi:hypothetical protein